MEKKAKSTRTKRTRNAPAPAPVVVLNDAAGLFDRKPEILHNPCGGSAPKRKP